MNHKFLSSVLIFCILVNITIDVNIACSSKILPFILRYFPYTCNNPMTPNLTITNNNSSRWSQFKVQTISSHLLYGKWTVEVTSTIQSEAPRLVVTGSLQPDRFIRHIVSGVLDKLRRKNDVVLTECDKRLNAVTLRYSTVFY